MISFWIGFENNALLLTLLSVPGLLLATLKSAVAAVPPNLVLPAVSAIGFLAAIPEGPSLCEVNSVSGELAAVLLDVGYDPPNDSFENLDALVEEPPEKNPESELSEKIKQYSCSLEQYVVLNKYYKLCDFFSWLILLLMTIATKTDWLDAMLPMNLDTKYP